MRVNLSSGPACMKTVAGTWNKQTGHHPVKGDKGQNHGLAVQPTDHGALWTRSTSDMEQEPAGVGREMEAQEGNSSSSG